MKPQLVDMSIGWQMVSLMNANSEESFRGSESVVAILDALNVFGLSTYVEWEWFITIGWNIIIFLFVYNLYKNNKGVTMFDNIFIYLNIAILNIFCFNMSKEPGQMLFFVLMALAIILFKNYRLKRVMTYAAILATTLLLRRYYGIVMIYFGVVSFAVEAFVAKVDTRGEGGTRRLILSILSMFIFFAFCQYILLSVVSVVDVVTYNEMISVNNRVGADAVSEIAPIFGTTNRALFTVDYFIKIFRLMFPVELLLKGKITYLFIIAYHAMFFSYIFRALRDINTICDIKKCALHLYIAFWLCSASFEPDFGSWIRHEGVAFPVIILLLYTNNQNIKTNEKVKGALLR
ncbi:MAG: hypothetical protein SNH18_08040 [Rikenellaceae bacterium]